MKEKKRYDKGYQSNLYPFTLHNVINKILKFHVGEYIEGTNSDYWDMEILQSQNMNQCIGDCANDNS